MLEGTDLMSAYQQPLTGSSFAANSFDNSYASFMNEEQQEEKPAPKQKVQMQEQRQSQPIADKNMQSPQYGQQQYGQQYDANIMNKQYEQEQRIARAINELKKRKEESATSPQYSAQPSYFDKLFGKKKELGKLLQAALIIVLGLSIYYLLDHYVKDYIAEHDLSFERQLFIRLLYPLSILFILWNLRVFVK
jgi:hypothetical protein